MVGLGEGRIGVVGLRTPFLELVSYCAGVGREGYRSDKRMFSFFIANHGFGTELEGEVQIG